MIGFRLYQWVRSKTMKNIWKWVLGIILVLVVAAGLFGLGYLSRTRMLANLPQSSSAPNPAPPQMGRAPMRGGFRGGMMSPRQPGSMRGMGGFGHGPFLPGMIFFGIFGRLIPLALALLVLYGAYRLGKGRSAPVAVPVTPAASAPPASHPCPACALPVQDGWNHCPNCGEKQA